MQCKQNNATLEYLSGPEMYFANFFQLFENVTWYSILELRVKRSVKGGLGRARKENCG